MDAAQIKKVCDLYTNKISTIDSVLKDLSHLRDMLVKIHTFTDEDNMDKANRWLGFVQGVFWIKGIYTIDEMRDHNKHIDECQFKDTCLERSICDDDQNKCPHNVQLAIIE